ncbi:MAG: hypothetical protein A2Z72_03480 [Omnitrophica bacterium RBG_13_46_9]|nr:MAG: hypothetical protein A2Z72_03480 [Omnitrophica bacterium RBG_13_46_9]
MKLFNRVAIIGVGEIGGSIGKDLKARGLAKEIIGIGRRRSSLIKARTAGAVDKDFLVDRIGNGVKDADLIILATPVGRMAELGKKAALSAKEGAIMTDVGSTKGMIVRSLEKILPEKVRFVGSHPMAGSEKGGPLSARLDLFEGRDCFITRTKNTDEEALEIVKKFWKRLGANTIEVTLAEHDRIVAKISQMVHLVASCLIIANKDVLRYAASGFRDTTRIALSDPVLWRDICLTNNKNIARSLDELIVILRKFRNAILKEKAAHIERMLGKARELRRTLG